MNNLILSHGNCLRATRFLIFVLVCTLSSFNNNQAQQSSTIYHMYGVPQRNQLNPAFQPRCNFYIGFPGISPLEFYTDNSSLSVENILIPRGDSLFSFLHPSMSEDDFLKNFGKGNYFSTSFSTNLLSLGFRTSEKSYFSINLSQKVQAHFIYPGDLMRIGMKGIENGASYDLSQFGIKAISYTELGLGVSHNISETFNFGYRLKVLAGNANFETSNMNIKMETAANIHRYTVQSEINLSVPGLVIDKDSSGYPDFDNMDFKDDDMVEESLKSLSNLGLALDLGIEAKPFERLSVSVALLDFGFIGWKNNTYRLTQDGSFDFTGAPITFSPDSVTVDQTFLDSLETTFGPDFVIGEKYTTYLPATLMLGAQFFATPWFNVGVLSKSQLIKGRIREQFTFSTNLQASKFMGLSVSYSIMNKTYNNIGLGLSFKTGPFNLYYVMDNIPLHYYADYDEPMVLPQKARTYNFRIGMNLIFGCNKKKKQLEDKPLML